MKQKIHQNMSLFHRTFLAFIASFSLLFLVLGGTLAVGYSNSLKRWSTNRESMVESTSRRILLDNFTNRTRYHPPPPGPRPPAPPFPENRLPSDVAIIVYDINKNPIHTNQQAKNQLENWNQQDIEKMMKPVTLGPKTIGYFVMEETRFRNDEANRKLWQSLIRLIIASAISAFAAAAGAAVIFARGLSQPAQQVAFGLDNLAQGRPLEKIPEKGTAEISRIARSANLLGERLENEQRIRAQWAQDIAHDLRTPTASIRSQLEAMLDGIFAPDPKRIRSLLDELSRVEGLVNDLDELMRLEEPNTPIRPKIISPTILYAFLQERFDIELKAKGIDLLLEVNNNGNPSAKLLADDALLQRALSNIISNAIRHSKTNSSVVLAISLDQKTCITIRNDGVPIPELEIPRLFDRLYRGEYARNTPGSGLGLTIAQRIIKLHGGNISIISNNECGATPGSPGTSVIIEFPSA